MRAKLTTFWVDKQETRTYIIDVDSINDKSISGPVVESDNPQADIDYEQEPVTFWWVGTQNSPMVTNMEPL